MIETFGAVAVTLYAAHHVGDYWVQTDDQAKHKGQAGEEGRGHCLIHVSTYLLTQAAFLAVVEIVLGLDMSGLGILLGLAVSGVTHYMADRREHGLMFKLARKLPGKANFLTLGVPRHHYVVVSRVPGAGVEPIDNPSLGTGAWALDQSWHIFWGVWVAGLLIAAL